MKKSKLTIKKIICLLIALSFVLVPVLSDENAAYASASDVIQEQIDDKKSELEDVNDDIDEAEEDLKNAQKDYNTLTSEIKALEYKIYANNQEIAALTKEINSIKAQITATLEQLEVQQEKIDTQNEFLNARLRTMYKNGNGGVLSVLLGSTSFTELLTNIELIKKVYKSDADFLASMQDEYEEIYQIKVELTQLKSELLAKQDELNEKKKELENDEKSVESKRNAVSKNITYLEKEIDSLQKEADALEEVIKQLQSDSAYTGGTMCWPSASSTRITSAFGYRIHPILKVRKLHTGIDIGASKGTNILAANDGTVITAAYNSGGYGYYIIIDHGGGVVTLYAHCSKLLVKKGATVKKGSVIALVGSTGMSTGPHLHFEIRINGKYQDPVDQSATYHVTAGVYSYTK